MLRREIEVEKTPQLPGMVPTVVAGDTGCHQKGAMKSVSLALLLLLHPAVGAQALVPPEIVRSENVRVDVDLKIVTVGTAQQHYSLFCNVKAVGCMIREILNAGGR